MHTRKMKKTSKTLSTGAEVYFDHYSNGVETHLYAEEATDKENLLTFFIQEFEYGRSSLLLLKLKKAGINEPNKTLWEMIDNFPEPEVNLSEQLRQWYVANKHNLQGES